MEIKNRLNAGYLCEYDSKSRRALEKKDALLFNKLQLIHRFVRLNPLTIVQIKEDAFSVCTGESQ
jgi:hypothetical protein